MIIAMETGVIPPNLHYNSPRKEIKALQEGRIKVVVEPTPWNGGYASVNSFGFGGANAHVLLKSHNKEKVNNGEPQDNLPRLVGVSGRTEKAVSTILRLKNSKKTITIRFYLNSSNVILKQFFSLIADPLMSNTLLYFTIFILKIYLTICFEGTRFYLHTETITHRFRKLKGIAGQKDQFGLFFQEWVLNGLEWVMNLILL